MEDGADTANPTATLVERLAQRHALSFDEAVCLLRSRTPALAADLAARADALRRSIYGTDVFVRGLIEFTNVCRNDCYYCGIRRSNRNVERYRLTEGEILACADEGHELGYRTFVLQGGEDPAWTPERVEAIVRALKTRHPDCAVTLSIGEHPRDVYRRWREAGADRYLLRHETADDAHYRTLHPASQDPQNRKRCLRDIKELGYAVGAGFMVGSPGQTPEHLAADLVFLQELQPDMVGIGPFIPQRDTPFGNEPAGSLELTLFLLSVIRLLLPSVLLPATTALGTIHPMGRELGIQAGANVCMPNLSPVSVRRKYALYDHKICTGDESAQCRHCLEARIARIGYRVVVDRGDRKAFRGGLTSHPSPGAAPP